METSVVSKFKVESFRRLPNPYDGKETGDPTPITYVAVCDIKELPDNFPMETNPREQKLTTNVAKRIKESLLDGTSADFYLLNRGILLSAKECTYNNYSNEITIVFDDMDVHGNVDGGHTYRIIMENRDLLDSKQQFVKLEIVTGVESIFQRLASARNTSVQVQDKSIAELEGRFQIIKDIINNQPYQADIFFKENDEGSIDVTEILAIINMFNIDRYPEKDDIPIISYSSKKKCVDYYIAEHKKHGESRQNPYVKMAPILADIFKLYDTIETNMATFYKQKVNGGRYGAVKGVSLPRQGQSFKSKFLNNDLDCMSPTGFLYPILGAFRALVDEKDGSYSWKQNPFAILEKVGGDLVATTVERSRSLGNNPQSTGKDPGNWKTLYMTVLFEMIT
ncbi:MAG: hypothetical protein GX653_02055 [Clostridiales bacterium]|nr:hypothetical protein [Clostridiales bacterium]